MTEDKFMLVSLKEDQAKKIAQVLANPTSTRILDELTKGEKTESEIAKKLKIPISTVHYNLQQLKQAKLVVVEEFHYSEKGREVNHYKLANKYIIIAPQEEKETTLSKLKGLLPITLITVGAAIALKASQLFARASSFNPEEVPLLGEAAEKMTDEPLGEIARSTAVDFAEETVNEVSTETVVTTIQSLPQSVPWWQSPMIDWAILGAFSVLLLLIVIEIIRLRKSS